jgi:hypothetical protein
MNTVESIHPVLENAQKRWLTVGVIGAVLCAVGGFADAEQFLRSYLFGYMFWFNLSLGCLAAVMAHNLTGGDWGAATRRQLEAGIRVLPLMALLFLPILLGLPKIYEWANPEHVAHSAVLQQKSGYLNPSFFVLRTAVYFVIWIGLANFLYKWSSELEQRPSLAIVRRMENLSGPGIVIYFLTSTFAAFDWVMSLDPHWYSTIYGLLFIVYQGLSTLAFMIAVTTWLSKYEPVSQVATEKAFHDLGKLTHGFIVLWVYGTFAQFLIIWSGNLPEEIVWYVHRASGGWKLFAIALGVFHFAVPFFLLLSRTNKAKKNILVKIAGLILLMRFVDLYWVISPSFNPNGVHFHWLDVAAPVGIGGLWLATFYFQLRKRPLSPLPDPFAEAEQALEHA